MNKASDDIPNYIQQPEIKNKSSKNTYGKVNFEVQNKNQVRQDDKNIQNKKILPKTNQSKSPSGRVKKKETTNKRTCE